MSTYFDLIALRHTNEGLEIQAIGVPSDGLMSYPEIWAKNNDMFIAVPNELLEKFPRLWVVSKPLPGYWDAVTVQGFISDMLMFLNQRFAGTTPSERIWSYWISQWDMRFNQQEQDAWEAWGDELANLVY